MQNLVPRRRLGPRRSSLLLTILSLLVVAGTAASVSAQEAFSVMSQGVGLLNNARPTEALPYFDKAISLDPQLMSAYRYRGSARQDLKDFDGAIADFTLFLQAQPDASLVLVRRAKALAAKGERQRAMDDLNLAVRF